MRLVDSHSHFDVAEFDADRDAALARARDAGVHDQVVPAIDVAGWENLRRVCTAGSGLHAAYGLHPMFLERHEDSHLDALAEWIEREKPVAVGECGLDYYVEGLDRERQRALFLRQLQLARDFDLPVIVHARRALDEVLVMLRQVGGLRGVVHSYSGSEEQARQLFEAGFHLGLGGPVTYERAKRLRRIVASMPLEWLLLETDAPDQPCAHRRGTRNEPAFMRDVLDTVASLRGMSIGEVAAATTANAVALFGLDRDSP